MSILEMVVVDCFGPLFFVVNVLTRGKATFDFGSGKVNFRNGMQFGLDRMENGHMCIGLYALLKRPEPANFTKALNFFRAPMRKKE